MRNEPFYFGVCVRSLCSKVELRNLVRHWNSSFKFEYAVIKLLIRCYRTSTTQQKCESIYSIKQIIMNKTECNCNLRVGESLPAVGFSPVGYWPLG